MKQYTEAIKGKLFQYFQGRLRIKKSTKGYWRCDCYYCGGNYSMGINIEDEMVHCFKCLEKKNPIKLLIDIEGFQTYNEAWAFLKIQQEYEAYTRLYNKVEKKETKKLQLPNSFQLLIQGDSMMSIAARNYMTKRRFNITRLSLKGVGYCTEGEYAGYIIFPYYRKGELIYFQGRIYMGNGPKMKNPPSEIYGIGKSQIIYNEDALFIYNKIYAMESITNCETIGDNAVALSGKSISSYQYSQIIKSPFSDLVIILDPDAFDKAISLALQAVHYKNTKVVLLPEGKDVNNIGRKLTKQLEKDAKYMDHRQLYKLKLNLENAKNPESTYTRVRSNHTPSRGF